ncbi:GHMP kinase, partial [bacterium]|nr:GHMP kinase [candidate division CSSED10-310 bacterium]
MHTNEPYDIVMPGRLCLLGEHSDWAGGYRRQAPELVPGFCLITPTDQVIAARASRLPGRLQLRSRVGDLPVAREITLSMHRGELAHLARAGGFFSYIAGVVHEAAGSYEVDGLALDAYAMDLPMKKGLSSSAAVCMLAARALNLTAALGLDINQEMDLAYRGELLTGSQCGRMDQACAFKRPVWLS